MLFEVLPAIRPQNRRSYWGKKGEVGPGESGKINSSEKKLRDSFAVL